MTSASRIVLALLGCLTLAGCGGYTLRGHVIEGMHSSVSIVDADDLRLQSPGLDGATIDLMLDPDSLGRRSLGTAHSAMDGSFSLPIDEFGAGVLEHEVRLVGRAAKHQSAVKHFILPSRGKRVLIVLAPGRDTYRAPEDTLRDARETYERYAPKE